MRISIIGVGTVGRATGIGFLTHRNDVLFCDIDKEKLTVLKMQGYKIAEDILEATRNAAVLFVCVPTPTVSGQMDFSFVEDVIKGIAKVLRKIGKYCLIVVRSTVLPSTTRCRVIPLLENYSRLKAGRDFGVCMNPEFLRQKHALRDFLNPSRIVIGEYDEQSGDLLEKLYAPFNAAIFRTHLDAAEMIKYAANLFLGTKISFFNEIYMICRELGLDATFISEVVSLDSRIGKYGIYGGQPFRGSCLPKDLEAFMNYVKDKRVNPKLLEAVFHINKEIASFEPEQRES